MGYHLKEIKKGELGKLSKIQEELDEIKDAEEQNCKIMIGCELADLYGAIESYAETQGLTMNDLYIMNEATKRAFKSGRRSSDSKEPVYNTIRTTVSKKFIENEFNIISNENKDYYSLFSIDKDINIIVPIKKHIIFEVIEEGKDIIKNITVMKSDYTETYLSSYKSKNSNNYIFDELDKCYIIKYNYHSDFIIKINAENTDYSENLYYNNEMKEFDIDFIVDHINNNDEILNTIIKVTCL